MGNTHERMANGIWVKPADQDDDVCLGILHERGATGLCFWPECEGVGRFILFVWSVWFVWFFWLNKTNQMGQINPTPHGDKPGMTMFCA